MGAAISWIMGNWSQVTAIALLLLRVLESIAAITPTDKDNKIIAIIKQFFRFG